MTHRHSSPDSPFARAWVGVRQPFAAVFLFSCAVNILGLTGSMYMLQVYDRVLTSRSVATLVALSGLALGLFALQGILEVVRSQVLARIGVRVERELIAPVHDLLLRLTTMGRSPVEVTQPVRDMEAVRGFMSGQAPVAFFDLPWMPFYLGAIFLLHPWLGFLSLGGMVVLIGLTWLSEHRLRQPSRDATVATAKRQQAAETTRRHAEVLRAMGFADRAAARFYRASGDLFASGQKMSDVSATIGGISRMFRIMLQSATLGLGAYLVLKGQMSAGAIIASSILSGRAMAPVEMTIANWKLFIAARQARTRLGEFLKFASQGPENVDLPLAKDSVSVDSIHVGPPSSRVPTLRNVKMSLSAGDGLAVMGPSGAGKSTLARALVGAWPLLSGAVRLDGAPLEQWPVHRIGQLIGYLPQDVELFDGTIAENIARLDPDASDEQIVKAAQAANVHDMILHLPQGYSTQLGEGGHNLSVGQRQRIGLARALYGDPFLVVLDEPNAHLDQEGEIALSRAIARIRERKGIVVAVSHRPALMEAVNLVAIIADGELKVMGPRDEVLKRLKEGPRGRPPEGVRPFPGPMQTGGRMTGTMGAARTAGTPLAGEASTAPVEGAGGRHAG